MKIFRFFINDFLLTRCYEINQQSTYNQRKDLNHAIVDLLLIYGERYVYSFSRSLKDGGQIELYELLENEAGL